jgi:peptide/nickel transport system permease protein
MKRGRFIVRRLLLLIPVLVGITLITFILSHVVPADPAASYLPLNAPASEVAAVRQEFGLNRPLAVQYVKYLDSLGHLNLGTSIHTGNPVRSDIATYLPATIELSIAALILATVFGVGLGILSAVTRGRFVDSIIRLVTLSSASLPVFFLGLFALAIFYVHLGWLPGPGQLSAYTTAPRPITGMVIVDALLEGNWSAFWDGLAHLVLPASVLAIYIGAIVMRLTRGTMLEVLNLDYVRTARAKGASGFRVVVVHALRNALGPTLTVIGLAFGNLLSGAVLVENIFSWPGIGTYATTSASSLDIPAIMGVTVVAAVVFSVANLIVDLLYGILDPSIAAGGR